MWARCVFTVRGGRLAPDAANADDEMKRVTSSRVGRIRTPAPAQGHWGRSAGPDRSRSLARAVRAPALTRGGSVGSPRCSRIGVTELGSVTKAISSMSRPQFGHTRGKQSYDCRARIVPTILLHSRHPWRSDKRDRAEACRRRCARTMRAQPLLERAQPHAEHASCELGVAVQEIPQALGQCQYPLA